LQPNTANGWTNALYACQDYRGYTAESRLGLPLGSYAYNYDGVGWPSDGLGLGGRDTGNGLKPIEEIAVRVPVEMLAFGDAVLWTFGAEVLARAWGIRAPPKPSGFHNLSFREGRVVFRGPHLEQKDGVKAMQARHRGAFNLVFCDGHIESIPGTRLFEPASPPTQISDATLRRWNNDNRPHRELVQ
jgi:prepilin-type processing-associated H-X9-DG protein